jgi:hypothetical protein
MKQYRPATIRDAITVANNLRIEDRKEVEGLGLSLLHLPFGIATSNHATYFFTKEGEAAGIAGVADVGDGVGQVWMLCTPKILEESITFIRQSKLWLSEVEHNYQLLWNLADARNHIHHKLLKHLGFKALRSVPAGPSQLPYYEIVKLCV